MSKLAGGNGSTPRVTASKVRDHQGHRREQARRTTSPRSRSRKFTIPASPRRDRARQRCASPGPKPSRAWSRPSRSTSGIQGPIQKIVALTFARHRCNVELKATAGDSHDAVNAPAAAASSPRQPSPWSRRVADYQLSPPYRRARALGALCVVFARTDQASARTVKALV